MPASGGRERVSGPVVLGPNRQRHRVPSLRPALLRCGLARLGSEGAIRVAGREGKLVALFVLVSTGLFCAAWRIQPLVQPRLDVGPDGERFEQQKRKGTPPRRQRRDEGAAQLARRYSRQRPFVGIARRAATQGKRGGVFRLNVHALAARRAPPVTLLRQGARAVGCRVRPHVGATALGRPQCWTLRPSDAAAAP